MKLFKKLLPATALVSAIATIAPFVASCSKTKYLKWEYEYDGIGLTEYESQFTPVSTLPADLTAAKSAYLAQMEQDKNVYADDLLVAASDELVVEASLYTSMSGKTEISVTSFDKDKALISFEVKSNYSIHIEAGTSDIDSTVSRELTFKNIKMDVANAAAPGGKIWSVCPVETASKIVSIREFFTSAEIDITLYNDIYDAVYEEMVENEDWSVSYKDNANCNGVYHTNNAQWNYKNLDEPISKESIIGTFYATDSVDVFIEFAALGINSHYLNP